jgi:hypothetical protein
MPENINNGGSRGYNTLIPSLSDNADIVSALKIYHYGSDVDTEAVSGSSIAGYLAKTVDKTLVNAKGDFLVGSADNTLVRVAPPAGNDYILVSKSSETAGVQWVQTNYQEDQISYVMGLY